MLGTSWHHEIPPLPCWFTIRGVHENSWINGLVQGKILTITGWWFGCHFWHFPIYRVSNHPNWRTHIFQRGSIHQPDIHYWDTPICLDMDEASPVPLQNSSINELNWPFSSLLTVSLPEGKLMVEFKVSLLKWMIYRGTPMTAWLNHEKKMESWTMKKHWRVASSPSKIGGISS